MSDSVQSKFIRFFTSAPRNHREIPSSSLVPENDPTVLFITAGMHPLVPYLMGEEHPLGRRLCDIQKSVRTDDIEEVGDLRHFTFFEMLGNWSLGDYFKKEAISWSFEFLTDKKWLGFDPEKIYVSIFEGDHDAPKDEDSIKFWKQAFKNCGITAEEGDYKKGFTKNARIFPYPKKKNWWGPAGQTGPCGPDSEMFYDTKLPLHDKKIHGSTCHINCDCGRYIEVWNDVFMEYNKTSTGQYLPLKDKNVDTGMGLERVTALCEWIEGRISQPDPFLTKLFQNAVKKIENLSGKSYSDEAKSIRIIADHARAASFMLADGVIPSNKERGYILRRIIRRAVRFAHKLGIEKNFLKALSEVFIDEYGIRYPELKKNRTEITGSLELEENKFRNTLKQGLKELKKLNLLDAKTAFNLYQSFGFPIELTVEIAREQGQKINMEVFGKEFKKHQDLSRTAAKGAFKGGLTAISENTTKLHTATHLLQQALRNVLGNHVRQKGSHITPERLRFDFSHENPITPAQLSQIENEINKIISGNMKVTMEILSIENARTSGALTVIGANYPEKVKVYSIGNFSKEVCAGPHVDFTRSLGSFKIVKEEAIGSGLRRIYAKLE